MPLGLYPANGCDPADVPATVAIRRTSGRRALPGVRCIDAADVPATVAIRRTYGRRALPGVAVYRCGGRFRSGRDPADIRPAVGAPVGWFIRCPAHDLRLIHRHGRLSRRVTARTATGAHRQASAKRTATGADIRGWHLVAADEVLVATDTKRNTQKHSFTPILRDKRLVANGGLPHWKYRRK